MMNEIKVFSNVDCVSFVFHFRGSLLEQRATQVNIWRGVVLSKQFSVELLARRNWQIVIWLFKHLFQVVAIKCRISEGRFLSFNSGDLGQKFAVKLVFTRLKVIEENAADFVAKDSKWAVPKGSTFTLVCLALLWQLEYLAWIADNVLLEEGHQVDLVSGEAVLDEELDKAVHFDELNQVHFALQLIDSLVEKFSSIH